MKKILILGAGIYQVPLIKKAKEMGLCTLVASIPGPYPGFALADEALYINTTDREAILAEAVRHRIDGIVTTGTDVAVRSIGYVCEKLGLNGIPECAAEILTDKARMKEAFAGKVSTAPFRVVRTPDEALQAAREIGFPAMVKACDVSGSRGVSKVTNEAETLAAFRLAQEVTHTDHFVVEGFTRGSELGLDAFVQNGKILGFFPHTKYIVRAGNVTVPGGHGFPFHGSPALIGNLRAELENIITATGLDNCAVNCDIMAEGDNVSVIEAGGRCGATCIPELIEIHTGIDYYKEIILNALGEKCDLTPVRNEPCIAKLLMSDVSGTLVRADTAAIAGIAEKSGADIRLDIVPGAPVHAMRNGTDRIGQVIMRTAKEADVDRVLDQVRQCLVIK